MRAQSSTREKLHACPGWDYRARLRRRDTWAGPRVIKLRTRQNADMGIPEGALSGKTNVRLTTK